MRSHIMLCYTIIFILFVNKLTLIFNDYSKIVLIMTTLRTTN